MANALFYFFIIFGFLSCNNKPKPMSSTTESECEINSIISSDCVLNTPNLYYYTQPYGGRGKTITGTIRVPDDIKTFSLQQGWYHDVTIQFESSKLISSNSNKFKSGVNIFGITGNFISAASPACNLLASQGLQNSNCSASPGTYLYSTAYNGRSSTCTNFDNGISNSNCWVPTSGWQIDTAPANPSSCINEGLQNSICTANNNSFFYSANFGGRADLCTSGYNPQPCWISESGKLLTSSAMGCTDNSLNILTCGTQPGRYVYMNEYGGRDQICVNDINGNCYLNQSSKSMLEPNLTPDKIKLGVSIFGVTGTFAGNGDWPSTAHRNQDTSPISILAESYAFAGSGSTPNLPAGYRAITSIEKDDDGLVSTEVKPVNRTGWGETSCGLTQSTLAGRIAHCSSVFGANSIWEGGLNGNAGQVTWKLVSRSGSLSNGKGREVWIDDKTKLIWSSLVSRNLNWCKAIGHSNNSTVLVQYREDDPSDFCDQDTYQNNSSGSVVSACFEESGFSMTDPAIDSLGKLGLNLLASATSPAVAWRLPTFYDYEVAEVHGIRFVMPDMGRFSSGQEWIATTYSPDTAKAWTFASDTGAHSIKNRNQLSLVRCVGR